MNEDIAADIASALKTNHKASTCFAALPPSHRQEYLRWIDEAKKPLTRADRIARMLERLSVPQKT
jgi:uncharacterized protein YdeI (YjbR/CyaY-like superfamily)